MRDGRGRVPGRPGRRPPGRERRRRGAVGDRAPSARGMRPPVSEGEPGRRRLRRRPPPGRPRGPGTPPGAAPARHRERRPRTRSRTTGGTCESEAESSSTWAPVRVSAPVSSRRVAWACTKSGLPRAREATAWTMPAGGVAWRRSASISVTSPSTSAGGSISTRPCLRRLTNSVRRAGGPSPSRWTRRTSRRLGAGRARCWTSSRLATSAQWRSSSSRSTGRRSAILSRRRSTASNRRAFSNAGSPMGSGRAPTRPGNRRPSSSRPLVMRVRSTAGRARRWLPMASNSGP